MRCVVPRQVGWPQERHVAAAKSREIRNVGIVRRQNEAIERAGLASGFDRVRKKRLVGERFEILAGNPFGSAARRNDAENVQNPKPKTSDFPLFTSNPPTRCGGPSQWLASPRGRRSEAARARGCPCRVASPRHR